MWTKEAPTEAGYYKWRTAKGYDWRPVEVGEDKPVVGTGIAAYQYGGEWYKEAPIKIPLDN